jgi:hypothetical protein
LAAIAAAELVAASGLGAGAGASFGLAGFGAVFGPAALGLVSVAVLMSSLL